MQADAVITWGLIVAIAAAVTTAVTVVLWITSRFSNLRNALISEIQTSRQEGDRKIAEVHKRVDQVLDRLQQHELHVAADFMPRDLVVGGFDRMEKAIGILGDKVDSRLDKVEIKFGRLEERITKRSPGA